jgi:UDP-N-acetyl-D-mannosaminuronic acid transferase (WecB/TagA/CpsF family)
MKNKIQLSLYKKLFEAETYSIYTNFGAKSQIISMQNVQFQMVREQEVYITVDSVGILNYYKRFFLLPLLILINIKSIDTIDQSFITKNRQDFIFR